jgi:hypothetical protein
MEKGILAIRLIKFALSADPELSLGDEERMEIRRAWSLAKQLLDVEEINSFKNVLRHYAD